jgi:DEAD/DEAH box helicase domain-containing protein
MPIAPADTQYFGPMMLEVCNKKLVKDKDGWYNLTYYIKIVKYSLLAGTTPTLNVCLIPQDSSQFVCDIVFFTSSRLQAVTGGAMEDKYVLVDISGPSRNILEEIEVSRALFEVYEGGIVSIVKFPPRNILLMGSIVPSSRQDLHSQ